MTFKTARVVIAVSILVVAGKVWPEIEGSAPQANLSVTQIVDEIQRHNQARSEKLKHYQSLRLYQVQYTGFPASVAAQMEVEVEYDAASGKSLRVVSQGGSKFLLNKVLLRAVESEREASLDKGSTALTTANYKFHLVGNESLAGRLAYILNVEPVVKTKFLYRGTIWVDAADFAVARIEAEPARNPSFWISHTLIQSTSAKTGDFWLPARNRSETKVRIGGTAVLTIDYGTYKIVSETAHTAPGS
jgi:hypothetical protein